MIRKIANVLFALIFLAGFGIFAYPLVSDQWNAYRQSQLISTYEQVVAQMEEADYSREWDAARTFQSAVKRNDFYGDAFGGEGTDLEDTEYWKILNAAEDGVMGYMTIPEIHVKLAIYHGVGDEVLQTGIGHLEGTGLPIGGEGRHSVLSAHRGLPSAKLFTDLDRMAKGDIFTVTVLNRILTYEVDQILIVEPTQMEALNVTDGRDYCTLLTCTPYGINSHRMFVRGHRIDNIEEEKVVVIAAEARRIPTYYVIPAVGIPLLFVSLIIMLTVSGRKRPKKTGEELLEEFKKNNGYK